MKVKKLKVSVRETRGGGVGRRKRNEGLIPGIVYSKDFPATKIELNNDEFVQVAERSYPSQVFEFESDNAELNGKQAIVKDIQREYLKAAVLHVDFQVLAADRPVKVSVPLNVHGEAVGVKAQGGVLTVSCRTIRLSCLPGSIPEILDVNISALQLGERIRTGDLELPEGATLAGNPMETVANVISGRLSRLAAAEGGAGEGASAA
ncbi:MAG: 50S ribosomal protein L25 [Bdellovibrionales bacterium]|nr:50S ribosomal protein L25 [Bdellovibrionales bacterium]